MQYFNQLIITAPNISHSKINEIRVIRSFDNLIDQTYLQSFPRVLLSSALWRCGYWSASFLLAAWAQTMKAFMGRFMWGFLFSPLGPLWGMGIKDQSYPFKTWETASWICFGNFPDSSKLALLRRLSASVRGPAPRTALRSCSVEGWLQGDPLPSSVSLIFICI